ncbi:bifunctional adenosine 5'-phosphosulfate phosphorylase/adenylylsulfatase HINT4 isoform X2 [Cornus florida]|uniref:bifunctional adenosine 5'-phosphosulfate phosphorylase/adenylylsulfatase HINT4 isoform X2 n=1 Tax=Cornus florida TaxID=4283 RepID=UPI00289AE554|nr:bifunctional adenosine 5'-phosphosulfate phosphorylase/adenylylsulfatase HINT4 isoform X2 [Cornus florida]
MAEGASWSCVFCQIARSSTSTTLLHTVRFTSLSLSVMRKLLLFKTSTLLHSEHISTVRDLKRRTEDFSLVSHMLSVGQTLLHRDAPQSNQYRFGFHRPPFNSVNHLHLHCLALPFTPRWKHVKYLPLGPLGGFIEAEKLLERIKPLAAISS